MRSIGGGHPGWSRGGAARVGPVAGRCLSAGAAGSVPGSAGRAGRAPPGHGQDRSEVGAAASSPAVPGPGDQLAQVPVPQVHRGLVALGHVRDGVGQQLHQLGDGGDPDRASENESRVRAVASLRLASGRTPKMSSAVAAYSAKRLSTLSSDGGWVAPGGEELGQPAVTAPGRRDVDDEPSTAVVRRGVRATARPPGPGPRPARGPGSGAGWASRAGPGPSEVAVGGHHGVGPGGDLGQEGLDVVVHELAWRCRETLVAPPASAHPVQPAPGGSATGPVPVSALRRPRRTATGERSGLLVGPRRASRDRRTRVGGLARHRAGRLPVPAPRPAGPARLG